MNKKKYALAIIIVLVIGITLVLSGCSPKADTLKQVQAKDRDGDSNNLRVGIMSDTQLSSKETEGVNFYQENLRKGLKLFKEQNVEMIIFAGDFCDLMSNYAYESYTSVFNEIYPDKNDTPVTQYIMGNHDYWKDGDYSSTVSKQKMFLKHTGQSPWSHLVVNGFHFIGMSPDSGNNNEPHNKHLEWLEEQIKIAEKDTVENKKPIFVTTHHNPKDTAYGSDDWGDKALTEVFKKHEQVVSISGHSHYSILDERSIWQGDFTAFTTQSMAYVELEEGKYAPEKGGYSSIPPMAATKPMALIMNVGDKSTVIERWNIVDKMEEKSDKRWNLKYPMIKDNFVYEPLKVSVNREAPYFTDTASVVYDENVKYYDRHGENEKIIKGITLDRAKHTDLVHSYIVIYKNTENGYTYSYEHFSDFYLGLNNLSDKISFGVPNILPSGVYTATVYARESYGKIGNSITSEPFVWESYEIK